MAAIARNIRFWGKNTLEGIGISLAASVGLLIFTGLGGTVYTGESTWTVILSLLPYYLVFSGMFVNAMLALAYFQTYFSVLLSMNATRREIVAGIMVSLTVTIFGILALIFGIWQVCPGDIAQSGRQLLPLLAAVFFFGTGICIILGTVILRWGKAGTIAMVILCGIIGAFVGGWISVSSGGIQELEELLIKFQFRGVLVLGIAIYVLAGVFVAAFTRKVEVRV